MGIDLSKLQRNLHCIDERQAVPGPKGDMGIQGSQGPKGVQGISGNRGITGPKGDRGATGPTGPTGQKGIKGEMGERGLHYLEGIECPKVKVTETDYTALEGIYEITYKRVSFEKIICLYQLIVRYILADDNQ